MRWSLPRIHGLEEIYDLGRAVRKERRGFLVVKINIMSHLRFALF